MKSENSFFSTMDLKRQTSKLHELNSKCGVLSYQPRHLQGFNSMKGFMGIFTCLLVAYGMASSYMSSVLPSIEKRYGFSSKAMGTVLAINDAGIVLMALVTAHFAGRGHRPRGIFLGGSVCGFALLLFAAPELLFPVAPTSILANMIDEKETLCVHSPDNLLYRNVSHNATVCALEAEGNLGALIVLAVAQFFLGAGSTSLMILGLPFIDDNVSVNDAPIYFAVSFFGRIFGPMLGFGLGAVCNNMFLDGSKPSFKQTDPRWISAWYLGFLVTGGFVLIFAMLTGCFPAEISKTTEQLAKAKEAEVESATSTAASQACDPSPASWKEFIHNIRRLVTNVAFMCRAGSNILDGMIITGFLSFFFKFIAQQYQISPAIASFAGGVPTIFGIALGVVGGGLLIKKCQLQPRHVCLMLVFSAVLLCIVVLLNIALGCERTEVLGLPGSESLYDLYEGYKFRYNGSFCSHSMDCGCSDTEFSPVCDPKSLVNFYSPCHAGCKVSKMANDEKYYDNCSCVANPELFYDDVTNEMLDGRMVGGFCKKNCPNVYAFVAVFFVAMFCLGLPLSGSIMIQYRLVDADLKSMSTGMVSLLTSAFGYLPAPIFVGAIVDSTCRLWQTTSCGDNKFCLLYDTDAFRWRFLVTAATTKAVGAVLDSIVAYQMWNMKFDRTEAEYAPSISGSSSASLSSGPYVTSASLRSGDMSEDLSFSSSMQSINKVDEINCESRM